MIIFPSASLFEASPKFSAQDVLRGVVADPSEQDGPGRIRIDLGGQVDRLQFYGLQPCRKQPVIYLRGDVMRHPKDGPILVIPGYSAQSPLDLQRQAEAWAAGANRPYIHLARPGILGSSGRHADRRREREIALVNAALDRLKHTFQWEKLSLIGHSGGGHLVAALMARRNDLNCAVIASGNVSVRQRNEAMTGDANRDVTGHVDFVDPVDFVDEVARHPPEKVIVLTDKLDKSVSTVHQQHYVDALRKAGVVVEHGFVVADDPDHHMLDREAHRAAFDFLGER
jgi:pimeloyl-ACP methyl ester carboxylesterase